MSERKKKKQFYPSSVLSQENSNRYSSLITDMCGMLNASAQENIPAIPALLKNCFHWIETNAIKGLCRWVQTKQPEGCFLYRLSNTTYRPAFSVKSVSTVSAFMSEALSSERSIFWVWPHLSVVVSLSVLTFPCLIIITIIIIIIIKTQLAPENVPWG